MKSNISAVAILAAVLALASCESKPYSTYAQQPELAGIAQKDICILSFSADPDIAIQGGSVLTHVARGVGEDKDREAKLSEKLAVAHLSAVVSELQKHYTIVGTTDYPSVRDPVATSDLPTIKSAIKEAGADLGIIVRDHFGWSWGPADAGIGNYNADVDFSILNSQGTVVWSFSSTAMVFPSPTMKGFLSGVTATTPADEDIARQYEELFESFPRLITGLIEEDAAGQTHKSRLTDYIDGELGSRVSLVNK